MTSLREQIKIEKYKKNLFLVLSLYFVVEYVRPQDFLNVGFLRFGLITISLLFLFVIFYSSKKDLFDFSIILIFLFTFLLIIYVPFATNTYYSYLTAYSLILLLPVIFSVVICIDCQKRLVNINWLFSFIAMFVSIYSLLNNGYGPGGIVGDANDAALFLVFFLPFTYYLLLIEKKYYRKLFLINLLVLNVGAIAYTSSRGGFVGLIAVIFVLFIFSSQKFKISIVLILISFSFMYFADDNFIKEITLISDTQESTANERLLSWESAWKMFLDNPLGVGGGNFPVYFTDYQVDGFSRPDMWGRVAHSLWFTLLPETGVVGTFLFFLLIYKNYKTLFRIGRECKQTNRKKNQGADLIHLYSISLIASLSGFLSAATFLSVLYYPHFWILTSIVVALNNIIQQQRTVVSV